jgi:hypothetical protein
MPGFFLTWENTQAPLRPTRESLFTRNIPPPDTRKAAPWRGFLLERAQRCGFLKISATRPW